jgi:predicted GNAT family acetyltransferase
MNVEHDAANHRFVVRTGGQEDAELAYATTDDGALDLLHTYVPPASRDQGMADALAHEAFRYARENGRKIIPTCHFVRGWLTDHPEERDLLA